MHEALSRANFERDVKLLYPAFVANRKWLVNAVEFPILDVTFLDGLPLRLRLKCDQWDELPPSVSLLNPDGSDWTTTLPHPTFHQDAHPTTGRPFICMIGSREYHEHSSHVGDLWANHKAADGMNLLGLLDRFHSAWRQATKTWRPA